MAKARRAREHGAALVEFALIAPVLFALLLGMITGGVTMSRKNSMTNAAREGARLGATLQATSTWADNVRQRVVQIAGGDLSTAQVCVLLVRKSSTSDTTGTPVQPSTRSCALPSSQFPEPNLPAGTAVDDCVVKIWVGRSSEIETVFFSRDVRLYVPSVARFERGRGATCSL